MKASLKDQVFSALLGAAVAGLIIGPFAGMAQANHALGNQYHWSDESEPRGFVTVVDNTPSQWPVTAATNEWGTEPNLDVYYSFGSCGGTGHCVSVDDIPNTNWPFNGYNCSEYARLTDPYFSNGHYSGSTFVVLNQTCGNTSNWTNRDRRALACHELGHVMGLGHEGQSSGDVTCMSHDQPGLPVQTIADLHEYPRDHDFGALHSKYSHND